MWKCGYGQGYSQEIALELSPPSWHTSSAGHRLLAHGVEALNTIIAPLKPTGQRPRHSGIPNTVGSTTSDVSFDDASRSENQAVRQGFSWLAVGNVINAACAWGRVALLARFGSAEMVGQLALAFAVCSPIDALADLGLSGSLVSDAKRHYRLRDYLGLRILTCGLTMLCIIGAAWTGAYDPAAARLLLLAGLVVVSESVCDLFQAVLQRSEQMRWVAVSLIVRGLLGLAFFAVCLKLGGSLAWAVCGFSLAAVATLLAIDVPRALAAERHHACPERHGGHSLQALLGLAWLSLPLGLATASLCLMTSIPRYWISGRLGNQALGGFAVAGSFMVGMSLVVGAMSQAASPRLARYHAAGNTKALMRLLRSLSLWLAAFMLISLLVMAVAGGWIIGLLFGPAYVSYTALAICLTLAAGLKNFSVLYGRTIASMRKFRTNLLLRGLGIAALVILLPGWIDWFGLMGAAWALALSWLVTILLSLAAILAANRRESLDFDGAACRIH
jgi:O-antigen/teichoic acid export membrane protein